MKACGRIRLWLPVRMGGSFSKVSVRASNAAGRCLLVVFQWSLTHRAQLQVHGIEIAKLLMTRRVGHVALFVTEAAISSRKRLTQIFSLPVDIWHVERINNT